MNVTYRLDTDSTGDPAIYFHIALADWAADTKDRIADTTGRVAAQLLARRSPRSPCLLGTP